MIAAREILGERYAFDAGCFFQINHALVRPDVGGHPIDLVYSLSSGEITELGGEEYTGSADSGILSLMARLGMESQWRWPVIDN